MAVPVEKRERKKSSRMIVGQEQPVDVHGHPLDSDEMQQLLTDLRQHWRTERRLQAENRVEMEKDEAFYDGDQWDDDDKKDAVIAALSGPPLLLVEGPPGTGKTTFITELVLQTLRANPNTRVLLTSQRMACRRSSRSKQ